MTGSFSGFTVSGTLRRASVIATDDIGSLLALAAVFYALPSAAVGLIVAALAPLNSDMSRAAVAGSAMVLSAGEILGISAVTVAVMFGGSILATIATVRLSCERAYGRPTSFVDGAVTAFRVCPAAALMMLVIWLGIALASLLLIVPGIILMCCWAVALPALVTERTGVLGSIRRSGDLTRHHRWAILGFVLSMALIAVTVMFVIGIGGALLAGAVGEVTGPALRILVGILLNTLTAAFGGVASAATYFELRRVESLHSSAQAAEALA